MKTTLDRFGRVVVPKDIRDKMQFFPVKDMDEVVKIAFGRAQKSEDK